MWPAFGQLGALFDAGDPPVTNASGQCLRIVPAGGSLAAVEYERRIATDAALTVRESSWHDLFNVLAWSAWPRAKAALNARHVTEIALQSRGNRSRVRDALTGFDEDGLVVAVSDPQLERLAREFRWTELFWHRRAALAGGFRVFVFGHALAEKLLAPFVGITGKALCFGVESEFARLDLAAQRLQLDTMLARRLASDDCLRSPRELMPLPVLGLPGWWTDGEKADFYADTSYFRPGRSRAR